MSKTRRTVRKRERRVVVSVNLPEGLYRELLELMELGDYVHFSDLVRAALRFYIYYRKGMYSRPPGLVIA